MLNIMLFLSSSTCSILCFVLALISRIRESHKLSTVAVVLGICGISIIAFKYILYFAGVM